MLNNETINNHASLIEAIHKILEEDICKYTQFSSENRVIPDYVGSGNKSSKGDYVVLDEDTALELGSPGKLSVSRLLWTNKANLVNNKIYIIGDSLSDFKVKELSFLQILIIELNENTDPFTSDIYRIKNLSNKIPGYMTRSIPDKTWVRIHKNLLNKGFTLHTLADVLIKSYVDENKIVKNIDVILIAGDDSSIGRYIPICDSAKTISSNNMNLHWLENGILTCEGINCSSCEEYHDCNKIKEILSQRRRNENE